MNKLLVTGGAGFIGSHLVEALLAQGHRVSVLDNLYSGLREQVPAGVPFLEADIRSEEAARWVREERFDVIFHQAAQMDVRKSVSEPVFDADVNILGSLNLLQAAVAAGTRRLVFASSGGAAYGEQESFPATEDHRLHPDSPYGITKMVIEHYLRVFGHLHGLQHVVLRYANVYGTRQSPHGEAGVVAIFARMMAQGRQPVINGDGTQTRDFVHVQDVVQANLAAMHCPAGAVYNVGTGVETDINTVFDLLNQHFGQRFVRTYAPAKPGEQQRSVISPERLQRETAHGPLVPFAQGLAQTLPWYTATAVR
jgi:UDP-glucose 4-epimerase